MKLKTFGLVTLSALILTSFTASSASATFFEIGGERTEATVSVAASIVSGNSSVLSRTDGSLANTCIWSSLQAEIRGFAINAFGPVTTLTFEGCTRPVTVHKRGSLQIQFSSGTNGTVSSESAEVTVSTPFGTVNCKTGGGTDVGLLTGVSSGHATIHVNAVLNCGFLLPSASWKGTYTVTGPTGLGVVLS